MKSVLMLCYHYPPAQNGGVERSLRFSEFLPEFGWQPQVITTDLFGKSSAAIHIPELRSLYKRLRGTYPAKLFSPTSASASIKKERLVKFVNKFLYIPDGAIGWIPFAVLSAISKQMDVIWTTSPPASSHLLGLFLKLSRNKPWIMDLRDGWTIEPINHALRESKWRMALEQYFERICLHSANAVILNTERSASAYRDAYPEIAHKFNVITNGYNPESFHVGEFSIRKYLNLPDNIILISHIGSLTRDLTADAHNSVLMPMLNAIQQIKNKNVRFLFVGRIPQGFAETIQHIHLEDVVNLVDQLPHNDAIQAMCQSNLLLFFDPPKDGQTYVRGKLYEYAASERPILSIAEEGASKSFLENLGNVLFANPANQSEIIQILEDAINETIPPRNPTFNLDTINYYNLTCKLANLLDVVSE